MSDTLNQAQNPATCCGNGCDISARRDQDSSAKAGAQRLAAQGLRDDRRHARLDRDRVQRLAAGLLLPGATLVCEYNRASHMPAWPEGFTVESSRRYGGAGVDFLRWDAGPSR